MTTRQIGQGERKGWARPTLVMTAIGLLILLAGAAATGPATPLAAAGGAPFELVPNWGGLDTEIGVRALDTGGATCGWTPGETVEIWWDDPNERLGTFTAGANGCFEGLIWLDGTERLAGSADGQHKVTARGSASGEAQVAFEQVPIGLHVTPARGHSEYTVALTGCGWPAGETVNVIWERDGSLLQRVSVDPGTGCIDSTATIPRTKDGLYSLVGTPGPYSPGVLPDSSAAAYWVQRATIELTPPEGPAGARVPLAGCNWFPNEQIDFQWMSTGHVFENWIAGASGCITWNSPVDPYLRIPVTATLGLHTIRASGADSGQTVDVPFSVVERSLAFDPTRGAPSDTIAVSGCGWVGNDAVTIEWGYPDPNGLPIRWLATVDPATGCFGADGGFTIDVPANTISGPIDVTATGDVEGTAAAVFTVNHPGRLEIPAPDGYAGDTVTAQIYGAVVGEGILFLWDDGTYFDGVGATTPDLTYALTLPAWALVGTHVVTGEGTKGFYDQAAVNVLDRSEIHVIPGGPILAGDTISVYGNEWAWGEVVTFRVRQGADSWRTVGSNAVIMGATAFVADLALPADLADGVHTLWAAGDKGRSAETTFTVTAGAPPAFSLTASYADPPPSLDGKLQFGEWDTAQRATFSHGFVSVRSDETRLYVLLDVLGDTSPDALGDDGFWLSVDVWEDQRIDAGWDLNFRLDASGDLIYEEYSGPNSFAPRNSTYLRSAYGAGFGCFAADGSFTYGFSGWVPEIRCDRHRVYEIAIDLMSILAAPGETVRVGVRAMSQTPAFSVDYPAGFPSDFGTLGEVALASSRLPASPPNGAVDGIDAGGFEIEVTQAVQDVDNNLHLVADKDTAVRVYPAVQSEATVRVFLHGARDGADLPGSPLVVLATVPDAIDREELDHTANFLLPGSWTGAGTTQFTAVAENLDGQHTQATTGAVTFHERSVPVYWVVPINAGSAASPVLASEATIAAQQSYLEAVYPVPAVSWVRRPWQDIGTNITTSLGLVNARLNDYHGVAMLSYALTVLFTGREPFVMPDQIYGFTSSGGGLANSVWGGGRGAVASGFFGTSREGTLAHEINHNLDESAAGSWGRHVTDPATRKNNQGNTINANPNLGCGAIGANPNWPRTDDQIAEIGFDTRLPWSTSSGGQRTVVPSNYPDFMSYCQSDNESNGGSNQRPTKWISPYRWQALFGQFTPAAAAPRLSAQSVGEVYYVSGQLDVGGTGRIDPVQGGPGIATTEIVSGPFSLEIQDGAGVILSTTPFTASFTTVEGEVVEHVYYYYQLPAQAGAQRIVLTHEGDVLDTIVASPNPPTVTVLSPTDGDTWGAEATIVWEADDVDGDALTFSVLYSPDGGQTWYPVAADLTGNSTTVNVSGLPGGEGGVIRVVVSDGFNTAHGNSAGAFTVPASDALVVIQSPGDGDVIPAGAWIELRGSASDSFGAAYADEALIWSVDGEGVEVGSEGQVILPPGEHVIHLSAIDESELRGEASVTITVQGGTNRVFLPLVIRQ